MFGLRTERGRRIPSGEPVASSPSAGTSLAGDTGLLAATGEKLSALSAVYLRIHVSPFVLFKK